MKLKSGSGDSKASAAFFDAIFEDPEAKVTQTEISETWVKCNFLGIVCGSEEQLTFYFFITFQINIFVLTSFWSCDIWFTFHDDDIKTWVILIVKGNNLLRPLLMTTTSLCPMNFGNIFLSHKGREYAHVVLDIVLVDFELMQATISGVLIGNLRSLCYYLRSFQRVRITRPPLATISHQDFSRNMSFKCRHKR